MKMTNGILRIVDVTTIDNPDSIVMPSLSLQNAWIDVWYFRVYCYYRYPQLGASPLQSI